MKASFLNGTSWAAAFKEQWRNLIEWLGLRAWCTKCSSHPSMPYVLIALCSDIPSAVRTMWAQFRLWPLSSSPPCRCQVIQSWGHLPCAHTVLRALWQQQAESVTLFWEHSLLQLRFCLMIWTWRQRGNPEKGPGGGVGPHQAEVMFAMTWAYVTLFLGLSSSCKATAEMVSVSHNCPLVCTFSFFFLCKAGNQTLWKFLTDWQLWRVGFCICVTSELSWKSSLGGMSQWHGRWACTFVISNL